MDKITYCEYKLLVSAERLRSRSDFAAFWSGVKTVAQHCDVDVRKDPRDLELNLRRVCFYDTAGYDLYRNAFILRRRIAMAAGLADAHETTFKFRHGELARAGAVDVRRSPSDDGGIRFKEEVLPPRDGSVGLRSIFSHNYIHRSQEASPMPERFSQLAAAFPSLAALAVAPDAPISLVNSRTIEETGCDTGTLVFARGYEAKSSIAVWRDRATERPLVGEFSFQAKFEDRDAVPEKHRERSLRFYMRLQSEMRDWLAAGTTKTALIYATDAGHD